MNKNNYVLSRLSYQTILIYLAGAVASGILTYLVTNNVMHEQAEEKLESIIASRSEAVEDYFQLNKEQVAHLATNEMIVRALGELSSGFAHLGEDLGLEMQPGGIEYEELVTYYVERLKSTAHSENSGKETPEAHLPISESGRIAQWFYIAKNSNSVGAKSSSESRYDTTHRSYHARLDHFMKSFGFHDLFLLNTSGDLIYSNLKEVDFGTNLVTGVYSDTGLGTVCRNSLASTTPSVTVVDFENYEPSEFTPASFLAASVWDGETKVGAVIFQLDPQKLNSVVSDVHGLGESGEAYVIGDDRLMRTDSRFSDTSSILRQEVSSVAALDVIRGRSGSIQCQDYRGIDVLSQYRPLDIPGLNWGIIAEIDEADLMAPARKLATYTIGILLLTLLIIAVISVTTLRLCVMRPLKQLLKIAAEFKEGNYSARVYIIAEDEFAALAESHNQMAESIEQHIFNLEKSLAEIKELRGLLPICSACKSIRDDDGYFKTVETYLVGRSNVEFTHTICTDCIPRLYPEVG